MKYRFFFTVSALMLGVLLYAQDFEFSDQRETYFASIGQSVRIPLQVRNTGEKPQIFVIRRHSSDLGSTQKGYFCLDKTCLEPGIDGFSRRLEPGQALENLVYVVETGLVTGESSLQIEVASRSSLSEGKSRLIKLLVSDERSAKGLFFQSKDITIYDVYPNPAADYAMFDYVLHSERLDAKLVIYNVLGGHLLDHTLPHHENRLKISTETLPAGVYFYTVYLDNEGILTRKLVVRR